MPPSDNLPCETGQLQRPESGPCYEMMARAAADVLFEWDLNTHELWWGGGLSARFGYARHCVEFNMEGWSGRIHPEDRARVISGVRALVESGGEAWTDEFRILCEDRGPAFVLARGYVLRDEFHHPLKLVGGMHDISSRRDCEQNLDQSRRQLRALSSRLQKLREEDRRRISRDLHDTLGQLLTGLKMDLGWIEKNLSCTKGSTASILEKIIETGEIADSAITEVQRIATELRPDMLDNLGLSSAIKCELEHFQQRTGIRCRLEAAPGLPESSPDISTGLFRILQEAMTNVVRHAEASEVSVRLWVTSSCLEMEVGDNGMGINPAELIRPGALGLLGMRERAILLGGSLEIRLAQPRGTIVHVTLPFHEPRTSTWDLPS